MPDHQYTVNIPSFPNYDLGAIMGGDTCNSVYTIQLNAQNERVFYKIAPNPVSDWLNIVYSSPEDALFELYDINGRRVAATSLFYYFKNRLIDVSSLPAGIYFAKVMKGSMEVWSAKIVVQH
ncbi:MAG: T9SS type A sorting domain-containing protein [Bacteroidetes bacterium]|nr:T9SS type A sorting domain-containing protein [Bacteroidota bacterium]